MNQRLMQHLLYCTDMIDSTSALHNNAANAICGYRLLTLQNMAKGRSEDNWYNDIIGYVSICTDMSGGCSLARPSIASQRGMAMCTPPFLA